MPKKVEPETPGRCEQNWLLQMPRLHVAPIAAACGQPPESPPHQGHSQVGGRESVRAPHGSSRASSVEFAQWGLAGRLAGLEDAQSLPSRVCASAGTWRLGPGSTVTCGADSLFSMVVSGPSYTVAAFLGAIVPGCLI